MHLELRSPAPVFRRLRAPVTAPSPRPRASEPAAHVANPPLPSPRATRARPALARSRRGYDHSWIGALALAAGLGLGALAPSAARAEEPIDHWTSLTMAADVIVAPNDLIFAQGKYWAAGSAGRMQSSTDGQQWNVFQTPAADHILSLAYGNGRFVAVGYDQLIMSSPDGAQWTIHDQNAATGATTYRQVLFADGRFIVVGGQGQVRLSPDGIAWTPHTMSGANFTPNQVTWAHGLYVAAGTNDGSYNIQTSPDGITWTRRSTPLPGELVSIGQIDGLFVAGGWSVIGTSPDGITWTKNTALTFKYSNVRVFDIRPINGRLLAYGEYGLLLSSLNGLEWTTHATGTNSGFKCAAYNGERLLVFRGGASASSGTLAWSDPWTPVATGEEDPVDPTPGDPATAHIANISTRAWVGTNDTKLITGFIVQGSNPKQVLIRAVGPTLANWGVAGTLVDPLVTLYDADGAEVTSNNDWGAFANQAALAAESDKVFAFPLNAGSKDAAMLVTLPPGLYSIHVAGADGGTGVALAEVYDCEVGAPCKLVNISSRGFIGTGDSVAIPGFIVAGNKPKKLLVRGVGPTLANWNVPATLSDPRITLYDADQHVVAENDNWGQFGDQAALATASAQVFAFDLNAGSNDAAMIVTVPPGLYTAIVSGQDNSTGVALVEVYEVE